MAKCAVFYIITTRDSWHLADLLIVSKTSGDTIPFANVDNKMKISPWVEVKKENLMKYTT